MKLQFKLQLNIEVPQLMGPQSLATTGFTAPNFSYRPVDWFTGQQELCAAVTVAACRNAQYSVHAQTLVGVQPPATTSPLEVQCGGLSQKLGSKVFADP